ncbi:MAG: hypothetical protein CSYNP_01629 [Syntrophus sp. SKADARSKE-3]|nr:hypothetical protein [Syntrophus sp. SKADARSKE-3]
MVVASNKTFYPTPDSLIDRMLSKIQGHPCMILEPSAGSGAIASRMTKDSRCWSGIDNKHHCYSKAEISVIEIDENLQATLRGHGFRLLDTDFLTYSGPDKFDLIIANPPFDTGDLHLLKAIDILYCGEIIFLLNAETIKNPYTNTRKELARKLKKLNADIEFIQGAFVDAERPTGVEVALVYIKVERKVEDDLFAGATDTVENKEHTIKQNYEVSTGKTIAEFVAEYNQIINIGTETILAYYKNYPKIWKYIGLNKEIDKYQSASKDLTRQLQGAVNGLLITVRTDFWRRTLTIPEVTKRMTRSKRDAFEKQITERCHMDFTENNIRQFIMNLIDTYEETLIAAVMEVFELMTVSHCYSGGLYDENIHYFNGWKTNKAFKVGKKVILPAGWNAFFDPLFKRWKLSYRALDRISDIDTVMNYFDALNDYTSIYSAVDKALDRGQSRGIESTYFTITCYKKDTIHLTFKDEDILRRFNVVACRGKEWLPHDYGNKAYQDMTREEKDVVDSFEGAVSYNKNLQLPLFINKATLSIAA